MAPQIPQIAIVEVAKRDGKRYKNIQTKTLSPKLSKRIIGKINEKKFQSQMKYKIMKRKN